LAIILVILGLLVFALRGVFGVFPDSWEWTGIVLAGLGLIMGVPSVLQMAMGRPKLMMDFDRVVEGQKRALAIFLKNPPLGEKSIWRKLGIRRDTIASLSASFRISEVAKVVIPIMHARIYTPDDPTKIDPTKIGAWRIALPPTLSFESCIMIAMWGNEKKKAIVLGDKSRNSVDLSAGIYRIEVIFLVEGHPIKKFREFIVGDKADDLVWITPQSVSHKRGSQS